MSKQTLEENDNLSDEEELNEQEKLDKKEEFNKKEAIKKKDLEQNGIQYSIHKLWEWNDEINAKINDRCREIEFKFDTKIEHLIERKTFQMKGYSFEKLNGARDELIDLLVSMAPNGKQVRVTDRRSKKTEGKVELGFSPLMDEEEAQPMIGEDDIKGLKGVFTFSVQRQYINNVLGRDILCRDYWKDICTECKVSGELNEGRKRIEINVGKRKHAKEAIKKLKQLENNFLREPFKAKRIPIVHYPNQNQLFNLCFIPLQKHSYFNHMKKIDTEENENYEDIHVLDYTLPRIKPDAQLPSNPAKKLRDFNFGKMMLFKEGLEYVRVHKGEVRFYGSLGKSIFTKVDDDVKKTLWKYTDMESIISRYNIKPRFEEIATRNYDFAVKSLTEVLGSAPTSMVEYFEIKARARNAPYADYTDVNMYVNMGAVSLDKVTLEWEPLINVDWTMLDRAFDFSTVLATRHTIRHDVKPFITFKKKLSINPDTQLISFESIVDFLHVKSINFKQVSRFKLHNSFIAELSCVENVPLELDNKKVLGKTGEGEPHFTIEICDDNHRKAFRQNSSLGAGDIVNWKVEDILGKEPECSNMVELVKTMLILVEKCQKKL